MSRKIKKKIIGLVSGLTIIGGSVATAVVLANLANSNIKSFVVSYDNLLEIRNRILSEYSKNAVSLNEQCTPNEFIQKVNDGSIKTWINDNFKDYFKATDENNVFDFNLKINQNDNEILLTLTAIGNQSLRMESITNNYDPSIVEFSKNSIIFKLPKNEFLKQQLFSHNQFNLFKQNLIANMQQNKWTFETLENDSTPDQKVEIMNLVSNLLGINSIFESIKFEKLKANDAYSITLTPNKDYVFGWTGSEQNDNDFIINRKELTINFNKIITIQNDTLVQLKQKLDTYLQNKKINYLIWLEHINTKNQIYTEFVDYIYEELNILMNNTTNDYIETIEILEDENDIYSLKIIPSSGYSFLSKSDYYENGNILLTDIFMYSYIKFNETNITSFTNRLQEIIDTNRYNKQNFNSWISSEEFKNYVSTNLVTSTGINLETTKIKGIRYDLDNNQLIITPTDEYRFKLLDNVTDVTVNSNGELVIANLVLFEFINFQQLDTLFSNVQNFIVNDKFSNPEFNAYVSNSDNANILKSLIAENLYISSTEKLNVNKIENIDFINNNLVISLDSDHTIYSSQQNEHIIYSNNTLTIQDLEFFRIVNLVKLDTLFNAIQSLINKDKSTVEEFNKKCIVDNLADFKTLISNNLFVNEQDKLPISEIINISIENNNIKISLNNNYIKYNLEQNNNFELEDNNLIVKNLNFYIAYDFDNLDSLFNAIQEDVKDKQFTFDEFQSYVTNNSDLIKKLIADNLYISANETLNPDKIQNVAVQISQNKQTLLIDLDTNYLKYTFTTNNNIDFVSNNRLIVNNLEFYTAYQFVNIERLFNSVQQSIITNKCTPDEFKQYVNVTNNNDIKILIANNLLISNNQTLPIANIIDVKLNDNYQLEIKLDKDFKKYSMVENNNAILIDNILTINNLSYYSTIRISNLNAAYEYLNNIIVTNNYSPSEFTNYVSRNMSNLKQALSELIYTSSLETLNVNEILDIRMSGRNGDFFNVEIVLNSNYKKYIIEEYENTTLLNNSIISFSNLDFKTIIRFTNITNLRTNIQNIINNYNYTQNNFSDYIRNNQSSLKTLISNSLSKSIDGPGSWNVNQISRIEYSNGNIKIYFNPPTKYVYSFESYSYSSFANNILTVTNFSYYQPSSTNYFTWSGTTITGLTSEGEKQTHLKIPDTCTAIGDNAFRNKQNLQSVIIPSSVKTIGSEVFYYCQNLNNLILSEGLINIGNSAFFGIKITRIKIPNSVTNINNSAFESATELKIIDIDANNSQLKRIEGSAFKNLPYLESITIPVNCNYIGYEAFVPNQYTGHTNLRNINIYSNVLTIDNEAFSNLSNLQTIYIFNITNPDGLAIYNRAFRNSRSATIFVRNNEMLNKIRNQRFEGFSPLVEITMSF